MKRLGLSRYALAIGAASALLAGCGGSQPPIGAPGAMPQSRAAARRDAHAKSWMLPGTADQDLLYISNQQGEVYVYTYPQGQPVGTLELGADSAGECSDSSGNVFLTTASDSGGTVYEYAHGGTSPIASLSDPGLANACSIDPATGDLAVSNYVDHTNPYNPYYGSVAIYAGAQGNPTMYYPQQSIQFIFCGYNDKGTLYLTAYTQSSTLPQLIRLASGSSSFELISVNEKIYDGFGFKPSVQWDGKHITVSSAKDPRSGPVSVYHLRISGSDATVIGTTQLKNRRNHHTGQSWIQGSTIVGIDYKGGSDVSIWSYPKGGKPSHTITKVGGRGLWGVTVSVASSH
jgi:hypothetical protein